MNNLIGQSLGRYHLLEQLGEGGMAVVYKAYDTRLDCDVAIKFIRMERLTPELAQKTLKRFEREAKSLARLSHPNIVKVTDYGEHEGVPYLVMPYLPGGTLKQRLGGRAMDWREAARLLQPVAEALDYAHSQGILHRDIKPSNILITQSGAPMLSDFGVAKLLEAEETVDLTATGVGVGTPEYMAPEQGRGAADPRSEVYSLGIVLYEMVTGRKPFTAETPLAVLLMQAADPLPSPRKLAPGLPVKVERVLIKALAKNPADRYQDMASFAGALNTVGTGDVVPGAAANRMPKLSAARILIYGGALLLFVVAGIWLTKRVPGSAGVTGLLPGMTPAQTVSLPENGRTPAAASTPMQASGLPADATYLSDLTAVSISTAGGNYCVGRDPEGDPPKCTGDQLAINGKPYAHSLFAHADSELVYDLGGKYDTFVTSLVMFGGSCGDGGQFTVKLDGRVLYASPVLKQGDPPVDLQLDIKGGSRLVLETSTGAAGDFSCDGTTWGEPYLLKGSESTKGTFLAMEDFEDGQINLFGYSSDSDRWEIVDDGMGNKVFQVDNRNGTAFASFIFGDSNWSDYVTEYRVQFLEDAPSLGVQVRSSGIPPYYVVDLNPAEIYLAYATSDEWVRITTKFPPVGVNTWHTVKVMVQGDHIQVWIDGASWIDEHDSRASHGEVMFFASPGAYLHLDDIQVIELIQ